MHDAHIGENAELYALGSLDELERKRVEAHVANCAECLRRLGEAEETVLALERETKEVSLPAGSRAPQFSARRIAPWWTAVIAAAAALFIGYVLPHPQPPMQTAQIALLHSHFNHAQFVGNGPLAKVMYARDRSWYYVVVEGAHAYEVDGVGPSGTTSLGATVRRDGTSELFVRPQQRFQRIELREGPTVVEAAQIR